MNKIFRVIWNHATQTWTAASELAKSHGKVSSQTDKRQFSQGENAPFFKLSLLSAVILGAFFSFDAYAWNNNTGSTVYVGGTHKDDPTVVVIGAGASYKADTNAQFTVAIGQGANASSQTTVAIGSNAKAVGTNSVAIGGATTTTDMNATAVGVGAKASGRATAIGDNANASTGSQSVAIGSIVNVSASQAIGIGNDLSVTGYGAIALGGNDVGALDNIDDTIQGIEGIKAQYSGNWSPTEQNLPYGEKNNGTDSKIYIATAATGRASIAIGAQSQTTADWTTAIGARSFANKEAGTAVGVMSKATGNASFAGGFNATAGAGFTVALGANATASQGEAIAIGYDSKASNFNTTALGFKANATKRDATALGSNATSTGESATAVGKNALASGSSSVAIGKDAVANRENSTSLGVGANATGGNTIAIGRDAKVDTRSHNNGGIAIGKNAKSLGNGNLAFGTSSYAGTDPALIPADGGTYPEVEYSMAIGDIAKAYATRSLAFGVDSKVEKSSIGAIAIGNGTKVFDKVISGSNPQGSDQAIAIGYTSNITGAPGAVILGSQSDVKSKHGVSLGYNADIGENKEGAVVLGANSGDTGSSATIATTASATVDAITYSGFVGTIGTSNNQGRFVSIGNTSAGGQRKLINLAAGEVSPTSTEAINGSQLYALALKQARYFSVKSSLADNRGNNGATGANSIAIGPKASAVAANGIAIGNNTAASGGGDIVIGNNITASTSGDKGRSVLIGENVTGTGSQAVALGSGTKAAAQATAVGNEVSAEGRGSIAIGADDIGSDYPFADNIQGIAGLRTTYGDKYTKTKTTAAGAIALGAGAQATGVAGAALGTGARSSGILSAALGPLANASADLSVAIGPKARATQAGGVALGTDSLADRGGGATYKGYDISTNAQSSQTGTAWQPTYGAVSVGTSSATRQIINVAAGKEDTDAVNVAQLKKARIKTTYKADGGYSNSDINTADNEKAYVVQSGDDDKTIEFVSTLNWGSGATAYSGDNIAIIRQENGKFQFGIKKQPVFEKLTITNGPVLSNTGIAMGNKKISGLANGEGATDAVNKGQLDASIGTFTFKGEKVNTGTGADTTGDIWRSNATKTFTLGSAENWGGDNDRYSGDNIEVLRKDNANFHIGLKTNATFDSVSISNGPKLSSTGLDMKSKTIANLTSGGSTDTNAANIADVKRLAREEVAKIPTSQPLKFRGDDNQDVSRNLGTTLSIKGGSTATTLTDKNIKVTKNTSSDGLSIQMAKNLTDLTDATFGDANANNLKLNSTGLTLTTAGASSPVQLLGSTNGGQLTGLESRLPTATNYGTNDNEGRAATESAVKSLADSSVKKDASNLEAADITNWKEKIDTNTQSVDKVVNGADSILTVTPNGDYTEGAVKGKKYTVALTAAKVVEAVQPELNKKLNKDASNLSEEDKAKWKTAIDTDTVSIEKVVAADNSGITVGEEDRADNVKGKIYTLSLNADKIKELAGTTNLATDLGNKANISLDNIDTAGKTKIKGLTKVAGSGDISVAEDTDGDAQKFTVSLTADAKNKLDAVNNKVDQTTYNADKANFAKTDLSNINTNGENKIKGLIEVKAKDGDNNLAKVTKATPTTGNKDVYEVEVTKDDLVTKLGDTFAKADATNITGDNVNKWKTALGVSNLNLHYKANQETTTKTTALSTGLHFKGSDGISINTAENGMVNFGIANGGITKDKLANDVKTAINNVDNKANKDATGLSDNDKANWKAAIDTTSVELVTAAADSGISVSNAADRDDGTVGKKYTLSLDQAKIKDLAGTTNLVNDLANKADKNLGNIDEDGKTVIKNAAKSAVKVTGVGDKVTVDKETGTDGVDNYKVSVDMSHLATKDELSGAKLKYQANGDATGTAAKEVLLSTGLNFNSDDLTVTTENDGKVNFAITNNAITADKIANGAVTGDKIQNGAVTENKLSDDVKNKIAAAKTVVAVNPTADGVLSLTETTENQATKYTLSVNEAKLKEMAGTTNLDDRFNGKADKTTAFSLKVKESDATDGTKEAKNWTLANNGDIVFSAGDGLTASKTTEGIQYDLTADHKATLTKVETQGIAFSGDSGTAQTKKLGDSLAVKGGITDENKLADNNIGVIAGAEGLAVKLAKDLVNLDSVTVGTDGEGTKLTKDGTTVKDADGNTVETTALGSMIEDKDGNIANHNAKATGFLDNDGNMGGYSAKGVELQDADGNTASHTAAGSTLNDTNGNTNEVKADGTHISNTDGRTADYDLDGVKLVDGDKSVEMNIDGTTITDGETTTETGADGMTVTADDPNDNSEAHYGKDGLTVKGKDGNDAISLVNKEKDDGTTTPTLEFAKDPDGKGTGVVTGLKDLDPNADGSSATNKNYVDNSIAKATDGTSGIVVYTDADGNRLVKENGKFYKANAQGEKEGDEVESKDVIASLVNPTAMGDKQSVGTATKLSNIAKGKITQGSNDAVNGSQLSNLGYHLGLEVNNDGTGFKAPQLSALEGSTTTPTNVVDALNAATDKLNEGITLVGNNHIAGIKATEINKNLGEAFTIVGGYTGTEASANNLRTVVNNGVLEIQMAEKPVFTEVTATDKVTVGAGNETAEITKDGTRIKGLDGKTANYTLDSSTIDDGQGNKVETTATGTTISDADGNTVETTALGSMIEDKDGNIANHNAKATGFLDNDGNMGGYSAKGVELQDADGNSTSIEAAGTSLADVDGNTASHTAAGSTLNDTNGNTNEVKADGTHISNTDGRTADYDLDGVKLVEGDKSVDVNIDGTTITDGETTTETGADGMTVTADDPDDNSEAHYGKDGLTVKGKDGNDALSLTNKDGNTPTLEFAKDPDGKGTGVITGLKDLADDADGSSATNKNYVDNKLSALGDKPLSFTGNDTTTKVDRKLGETLTIEGEGSTKDGWAGKATAANNLYVESVADVAANTAKLVVKLAKDLVNLDSVTVGTDTAGTKMTKDGTSIKDGNGNSVENTALGSIFEDKDGNNAALGATGAEFADKDGNEAIHNAAGSVIKDTDGNTNEVAADGTHISNTDGRTADYDLDGVNLVDGDKSVEITPDGVSVVNGTEHATYNADGSMITDGTNVTTVSNDGTRITGADDKAANYTLDGSTIDDGQGNIAKNTALGSGFEDKDGNIGGISATGAEFADVDGNEAVHNAAGSVIKDTNGNTNEVKADGTHISNTDGRTADYDLDGVKLVEGDKSVEVNIDGTTITDGDTTTETGADGMTVTADDPDDNSEAHYGKDGLTVKGKDGNDAISLVNKEKDGTTTPTLEFAKDPDGKGTGAVTGLKDLADDADGSSATNKNYVDNKLSALGDKPLSFTGNDTATKVDRKLGETLTIEGEGSTKDGWAGKATAANNLYVESAVDTAKLVVKLAKDLVNLDSVSVGNDDNGVKITKDGTTSKFKDANGNVIISELSPTGTEIVQLDPNGDEVRTASYNLDGSIVNNGQGNSVETTATGSVIKDADGNTNEVAADGTHISNVDGRTADYDLDGVNLVDGDKSVEITPDGISVDNGTDQATYNADGSTVTDGTDTTTTKADGVTVKSNDPNNPAEADLSKDGLTVKGDKGEATYGQDGLTVKGTDGTNAISLTNKDGNTPTLEFAKDPDGKGTGVITGLKDLDPNADGSSATNKNYVDNSIAKATDGTSGIVVYTDADGNRLVKDADGKFYKADEQGQKVGDEVESKDVIASLVNPAVMDNKQSVGTATKLSNIAKGKIAQGSKDAVNGSQLSNLGYHLGLEVNNDGTGFKAPQLSALEGSTTTPTNVVDALNAATDKLNEGITLVGNNHITGIKATEINKNLGEAFTIVGGYTGTEASANNLRTVVKNGVLEIQMAEKPVFTEVTATDKVTVGAGDETAEITKDGTRIKGLDGKTANYTLDSSTIDDGQGNKVETTATGSLIKDADGNTVETTALGSMIEDKDGNIANHNAKATGFLDNDGNMGGYSAKGVELQDADGNSTSIEAAGTSLADVDGNTASHTAAGSTLNDTNGNTNEVKADGTHISNTDGRTADYDLDGVKLVEGDKSVEVNIDGTTITDGETTTETGADGMTVTADAPDDNSEAHYGKDGLTVKGKDGNDAISLVNKEKDDGTTTPTLEFAKDPDGKGTGAVTGLKDLDPNADGSSATNKNYVDNSIAKATDGTSGIVVYTDADGNRLVKDADGKFYKADEQGQKVGDEVESKDVIASLVNPAVMDNKQSVGTATKLSNIAKGKIAQGSKDAVNGSQLSNLGYHLGLEVNNDGTGFKAPQLSALEGSTTTPTNVVDALNAATDKLNEGITLVGNNHIAGIKATEINKNLGEAFTIVGGYAGTEASANNLRTVVKNGVLEIQMAEKPVFSEVTATDKVTVGAGDETAEITKDGTRIKGLDGKTANYTLDGSTIDDGQGNSVETTALYNRFIDKDGNLSNHNARGTGYLDSDGNVGGYNAKGVELVDIDGNEAAYTAKGIDYAKDGEKGTGTITGLKDLDDQSHGTTAVNKNYVDGKFTNIVGDMKHGDVKLDKDGNILTKDEAARDPSKVAKTIDNVLVDSDGKPVFVTHNVDGRGEYIQNDIASAVRNMNEQGIKYFHTNDGQNRDPRLDDVFNKEDAKASGKYSTAVGYQAHAEGENAVAMGNNAVASAYSLAIGPNAKATGKRSVSVGIGNIVEADSSGAFGDPNYIDGKVVNGQTTVSGSYAVGNNNVINSSNTFVFGSNVNNSGQVDSAGKPVAMGDTVENSVYLGDRTTATKGNGVGTRNRTVTGEVGQTTTAGDKGTVATATVGGVTYGGFAGAVANGVVSVGAAGAERRIQNVAAGEISPTSTDAINGSQLYSVANTLSQGMNNMANNVNMNFNRLNNRISDVDRKLRSGIAGAVAMSTLVQAYNSSDSLVSIGTGTYRGSSALAVGYSRVSDNGKILIKLSGSVNNAGHYMGGASVGYRF